MPVVVMAATVVTGATWGTNPISGRWKRLTEHTLIEFGAPTATNTTASRKADLEYIGRNTLQVSSLKNKPRHRRIIQLSWAIALLAADIALFSGCSAATTSPSAPTPMARTQQAPATAATPTKPASGAATPTAPAKATTPQLSASSPAQSTAVPPSTTSATRSSLSQPTPANRVQKNQGGSVTIEATWGTQQNASDSLRFDISMDTHSVNLDQFDLSKLAALRNDKGQQVTPTAWEAPPGGGHHRAGPLVFPSTSDGKPLIGADTKYVELTIRDVAGVKERVLRWNLEAKS